MKQLKWIGIILLGLLTAGPALATDEARQAYDKMVEEATQEADEYVEEKQKKMQETEKKKRIEKDTAFQEQIQEEREKITAEMDRVQQRGMSPTFTQGMKDNLLKSWQDRLDLLNSDPEAYFSGQ